jgi:hypothetical protein
MQSPATLRGFHLGSHASDGDTSIFCARPVLRGSFILRRASKPHLSNEVGGAIILASQRMECFVREFLKITDCTRSEQMIILSFLTLVTSLAKFSVSFLLIRSVFPLFEHVYGITDLSSPSREWDAQRGLRRTRSDPTAALPRCAPYRASKANRACQWSVCVLAGSLPSGNSLQRRHWLAGVGGFELTNALPKVAFEVWPEFPFISQGLAIRDFSRLSCQRVTCTPVASRGDMVAI